MRPILRLALSVLTLLALGTVAACGLTDPNVGDGMCHPEFNGLGGQHDWVESDPSDAFPDTARSFRNDVCVIQLVVYATTEFTKPELLQQLQDGYKRDYAEYDVAGVNRGFVERATWKEKAGAAGAGYSGVQYVQLDVLPADPVLYGAAHWPNGWNGDPKPRDAAFQEATLDIFIAVREGDI